MLMECPLFQHKSFSKLQLLRQTGINRRGRRGVWWWWCATWCAM